MIKFLPFNDGAKDLASFTSKLVALIYFGGDYGTFYHED